MGAVVGRVLLDYFGGVCEPKLSNCIMTVDRIPLHARFDGKGNKNTDSDYDVYMAYIEG